MWLGVLHLAFLLGGTQPLQPPSVLLLRRASPGLIIEPLDSLS